MAQHNNKKENAEEVQFTGSLTLTLCANNCGLHGNPATANMCASCFHSKIRPESPSGSGNGAMARPDPVRPAGGRAAAERAATQAGAAAAAAAANRCVRCGKRVGLTGFRCRCGDLFCGDHRYSDRHDCGFDYKAIERERIRRENPPVRAAKLVRI